MPRYLVERTFHEHFALPGPDHPEQDRLRFIDHNTLNQVVWIYSYVSPNRKKSYCIYDAPSPEALRLAAQGNDLPVDRIIEVQMLDPYLFRAQESSQSE